MRFSIRTSWLLFVAVVITSVPAEAQINLRPGEYEMEIDFGIPADGTNAVLDAAGLKGDGNKRRECITPDQLKGTDDLVKLMISEMEDENCKVSDVKKSSNGLSLTTTCVEDGVRMTWNVDMTFGSDSFTSMAKGKGSDGTAISGKVSAKRIGDCSK